MTPKSEGASACYTNYFRIGHNDTEFVLEFGESYDEGRVNLHTRLVISPTYAADLLGVLRKSLREYERAFGNTTGDEPHGTGSDSSAT